MSYMVTDEHDASFWTVYNTADDTAQSCSDGTIQCRRERPVYNGAHCYATPDLPMRNARRHGKHCRESSTGGTTGSTIGGIKYVTR